MTPPVQEDGAEDRFVHLVGDGNKTGTAHTPQKLWLWKNFVDGKPEYWAFDNPYPIHLNDGDPQTLGEPCGYAIFKPSRNGRPEVPEERVLAAIARSLLSKHGA